MKPLQILLLTCVLSLPVLAADAVLEIQPLLAEGQKAFARGDYESARTSFDLVYKLDPRNQLAISYLRKLKEVEKGKGKAPSQEQQLSALVIPQIQFRDATLGSALDYLKKAVDRESGGKQAVNFVVQLPAEQVNTQTVTLNLANVPFTEALKYLGGVANLNVEYDKYAIILKPKSATSATAQ